MPYGLLPNIKPLQRSTARRKTTPWETLSSTKHLALEKQVDQLPWQNNNRVAEDVVQSAESDIALNDEQPAPEEPNLNEINLAN
ncbi:hypothetical protein SAMN06265218_1338 [Fodinibius sediminis]|uniref:Uncharacterized protein n=1 Tax=Fodinibius sediminis TaxID=1214077 RepID=A0A521FF54_9BACT|nr:hypothetical protein SAMN06265218_1338 [Fodinibius sediminis]